VKSGLPGGLEKVVSKAMAKRPADRYATAGALLADFAAVVDPKGVRRRTAPLPVSPGKPAPAGKEAESEEAVTLAPPRNAYHGFRRDTLYASTVGVVHGEFALLAGVGTLVGILTQSWPIAVGSVAVLFVLAFVLGYRKALTWIPLTIVALVSGALVWYLTGLTAFLSYDHVQISHFWFDTVRMLTIRHQIIAGAAIGGVVSLAGLYVMGSSRKEPFLGQFYVGVFIGLFFGGIGWLIVTLLGSIFDWGFGFGYGLLYNVLDGFLVALIAGIGLISLFYVWKKAFSIDFS
jgi:hypothetical protein